MSKDFMRLPTKPFFDFTKAEKQQFFDLMEVCIRRGTKVILGQTRCFFCGTELDSVLGKKQVGMSNPLIMVNLCHKCWTMPKVQDYLRQKI